MRNWLCLYHVKKGSQDLSVLKPCHSEGKYNVVYWNKECKMTFYIKEEVKKTISEKFISEILIIVWQIQ